MMSAKAKFGAHDRAAGWRFALCTLLALFFLYNPFITIGMSSVSSAGVHHPASYRSTVASSELGCATVQPQRAHLAPLKALVTAQPIAPLQRHDIEPAPTGRLMFRAVTQDVVASLWFRPPPVL
jgi:hypothetical protein